MFKKAFCISYQFVYGKVVSFKEFCSSKWASFFLPLSFLLVSSNSHALEIQAPSFISEESVNKITEMLIGLIGTIGQSVFTLLGTALAAYLGIKLVKSFMQRAV